MRFNAARRGNGSSHLPLDFQQPLWYVIRREPFYHKLQYSKTPKYDPMAAFLGAAMGAFAVYMGLSTFGTSGADLTDLTIAVWYGLLFIGFLRGFLQVLSSSLGGGLGLIRSFVHAVLFLFFLVFLFVAR
jgi:H+/Cl- antiporter ClcA